MQDFETKSHDMLQTLQENKVSAINLKLKNFFKKWNQCNDTAIERLSGLHFHSDQFEDNLLTEWKHKVLNVLSGLNQAVEGTRNYCYLPLDIVDLQDYLLRCTAMFDNASAQIELVNDEKQYGHDLIDTNQVQKKSNKEIILADISDMKLKKSCYRQILQLTYPAFFACP